MAIWNNFTKKASDTTEKAIQKAKDLTETAKISLLVSQVEEKQNKLYLQLGMRYAKAHSHDFEADFADLMEAIATTEQQIRTYQQKIQELKSAATCAHCGAVLAPTAAFCSVCGSRVVKPQPAASQDGVVCPACGAVMKKNMKFCTACGNALPVYAPVEMEAPYILEEAPMPRICPYCGSQLEDDAKFCTNCGGAL